MLSIIISLKTGHTLERTLDSIFLANAEAAADAELIVLDRIGTEDSHAEYQAAIGKYTGKNISLIPQEGNVVLQIRQLARQVRGNYVAIIESGAVYSAGALKAAAMVMDETDTASVSIRPVYEDPNGKQADYPVVPQKSGEYSVLETTSALQFLLKGYFIRKSVFETVPMRPEAGDEYAHLFLMDMFLQYETYQYLSEYTITYFVGEENDASTNPYQYNKSWYTDSVRNVLTPYLKESSEKDYREFRLASCAIMYLLYMKFRCNENDKNKNVLNRQEYETFLEACKECLAYIDEDVIMLKARVGRYVISRHLKMFMVYLRCQKLGIQENLIEEEGNIGLRVYEAVKQPEENNVFRRITLFGGVNVETLQIQAINYVDHNLEIDAVVSLGDLLDRDRICVFAEEDDKQIDAVFTEAYALRKYFGVAWTKGCVVHFTIPVNLRRNKQRLNFFYVFNGRKNKLRIRFPKNAARLSGKVADHGYWKFTDDRILYRHRGSLFILKQDRLHAIVREWKLWKEIRDKNPDNKELAERVIRLRKKYFRAKNAYKNRRIWLTGDKLYKAGDNGEYMYHYVQENVKDVELYYVIKEDSEDYQRLNKAGARILIHGSEECQLMALMAEAVLATHTTIMSYFGIPEDMQPYVKDLFNAEVICIQHGLTIQKIAQYQGRLVDNTNFYCCASKYEVENILHPVYDYSKENIALTGLARYDGLVNNDQKQILITPTWRKELANLGIGYIRKAYNHHFKNSEYFKVYNELINDQKLINCAKANGYKLIYLLHPAMSAQIDDFTRNEDVEIIQATSNMSYEKILTESSLMVTDYSGVQFDFAYMGKPVLYYHPDVLPPHYEEGGFHYETMGFGPICHNHEEIVDSLCEAMNKQCQNEEKYIQRADDFFAYHDHDNCRRIYEAVKGYLDKRKK